MIACAAFVIDEAADAAATRGRSGYGGTRPAAPTRFAAPAAVRGPYTPRGGPTVGSATNVAGHPDVNFKPSGGFTAPNAGRPGGDFKASGGLAGPNVAGRTGRDFRGTGPGAGQFGRSATLGPRNGPRGPAEAMRFGNGALARNGLPRRPFPGEPGFTGVPPAGETRFLPGEVIIHVRADVAPATLDAAARRLGLTSVGSQNLTWAGGTLVHFRINDGRQVPDTVRALEAEGIGIAQPNYVFRLTQDGRQSGLPSRADSDQYVIAKLHLAEAQQLATGAGVTVAIIDSQVDAAHPDLAGSIAGQFDAVAADRPDQHGTAMTGAIAAHNKLLGVAPGVRILAIHAFSPDARNPEQATTQNIVAGIDWAIHNGAGVINMSFAGPYDPILQAALNKAHENGIVLIAAAGNLGPQSPPLYPAADENVIAVTAVDKDDRLLPEASQGPHIALAAPGVHVADVAPQGTYGYTTGTSVAAAHVSGVAALILERNPSIGTAGLEDLLYSTAKDLGAPGRDSKFGYGLVDPYRALASLEAKVAALRGAPLPAPAETAGANAGGRIPMEAGKLPAGAATLAPGPAASPPARSNRAVASVPLPQPRPAAPRQGPTPGRDKPVFGQLTPFRPAAPSQAPQAAQAAPTVTSPASMPTVSPPPPAKTASSLNWPDDTRAAIEKKRLACQQDSLRNYGGGDLRDYVVACVQEARLACLRKAAAQNVPPPDRRDFLSRCLAS